MLRFLDVRPPTTHEQIRTFERDFGHSLPTAYIDLLLHQDGGELSGYEYPIPEDVEYAEPSVEVLEILGLRERTALTNANLIHERRYPPGLVVDRGDGHRAIMMDYSASSEPRIVLVDMDSNVVITLAQTFADFLEKLESIAGDEETEDDDDTPLALRLNQVTNEDVEPAIASLGGRRRATIESARIHGSTITGTALSHLKRLPALKHLDISKTNISENDLHTLSDLRISRLNIANTPFILDAQNAERLRRVGGHLVRLTIHRIQTRDDGIRYLEHHWPGLEVELLDT